MRLLNFLSIRGFLVLIVLMASAPSLTLVAWVNINTVRQSENLVLQNAQVLAENLGMAQRFVDTLLVSTLDFCVNESVVENLNLESADLLFKRELSKMEMLEDILLLDTGGKVLISAKTENFFSQASRDLRVDWLSDVSLTGDPSVGKVVESFDEEEGNLCIPYVRAFAAQGASHLGYAVAMLVKTYYMEDFITNFLPPTDWSLGIMDVSGTFMVHHSLNTVEGERSFGGKMYAPIWDSINKHGDSGSFRAESAANVERIFGYSKIRLMPEAPVHAVASVFFLSSELLKKEQALVLQSVLLVVAISLSGVLFAIGVGRTILVYPIDRLMAANKRFARGDLTSRANIQGSIQEIEMLSKVFDDMASALEAQEQKRRQENEAIKEQAHRDYLTGTYNRRAGLLALERLVAEAMAYKTLLSIFFIDIDYFKLINDQHGHNEGDKMLKRVTLLLERHLRTRDVLCRYGGDEFLVILPGCSYEAAEEVWKRIKKETDRLDTSGKIAYKVSLSHGLAVFDPAEPVSMEALIEQADIKMYEEKALNKAPQETN